MIEKQQGIKQGWGGEMQLRCIV